MQFSGEFVQNVLRGDNPEAQLVKNETTRVSDYCIGGCLVFRYDGRLYEARYNIAAYSCIVASDCPEVFPRVKTVVEYVPVGRASLGPNEVACPECGAPNAVMVSEDTAVKVQCRCSEHFWVSVESAPTLAAYPLDALEEE